MSRVQVPSPAFSKPKANALGFGAFGKRGCRLDPKYANPGRNRGVEVAGKALKSVGLGG
jgi:hypothetical protein